MAETHGFSYAEQINSDSPMWMGFLDQQTSGSGPAAICTFAGNSSARLTTARAGDYFGNGSMQERFLTATRRQNFLIPPRRHRAFPLVELA
jgi:hypothetical protein